MTSRVFQRQTCFWTTHYCIPDGSDVFGVPRAPFLLLTLPLTLSGCTDYGVMSSDLPLGENGNSVC